MTDPEIREPGGPPPCGYLIPGITVASGAVDFAGTGIEHRTLVEWIANELRTPVDDRTGLSGYVDVRFQFESPNAVKGLNLGADRESGAPPLRSALRDQLGLKLERGTGAVQITVIEAARAPTPD
jgi:uncharacterized protein (TIGR03435 family)